MDWYSEAKAIAGDYNKWFWLKPTSFGARHKLKMGLKISSQGQNTSLSTLQRLIKENDAERFADFCRLLETTSDAYRKVGHQKQADDITKVQQKVVRDVMRSMAADEEGNHVRDIAKRRFLDSVAQRNPGKTVLAMLGRNEDNTLWDYQRPHARAVLERLPAFVQEKDYSCAAAVARAICVYFNKGFSEEELRSRLGTNAEVGTWTAQIRDFFQRNGFEVIEKEKAKLDDVVSLMNDGFLVLVDYSMIEEFGGLFKKPQLPGKMNMKKVNMNKVEAHIGLFLSIDDKQVHLLDPWYGKRHVYYTDRFIQLWYIGDKYENKRSYFLAVKS